MRGLTVPHSEALQNYYSFTAIVIEWITRGRALVIILTMGFLIFLGISYAAWQQIQNLKSNDLVIQDEVIRVALLGLTISWFAWYLLFSNAWFRYFYPPLFVGSLFAAAFLHEITNGFSWKATLESYTQKSLSWKTILLPFVTLWILSFSCLTLFNWISVFANNEDNYLDVAQYVDKNIAQNALIETYETDMLFLLPQHRFHFPADQVHVDVETHTLYGNADPFGYNPLIANPDFLILGPYNEKHNLYDQKTIDSAFILIAEFPGYQIYERVR
jgi:hypothetical protein